MKIIMGVTLKMRLYNVYRLCKQYINILDKIDIKTDDNKTYKLLNWGKLQNVLSVLEKIPVLQKYTKDFIKRMSIHPMTKVTGVLDIHMLNKKYHNILKILDSAYYICYH